MPKRSNLKGPGKCVFCGGGGMSKEHIWSDWLDEVIPRGGYRFESSISATVGRTNIVAPKKIEGAIHSKKARIVCQKCNNEWMSMIVSAAKPAAKALILGDNCVLNLTNQTQLATWISISAIMATAKVAIPSKMPTRTEDLEFIFQHRIPPLHWFIGVGYYVGEEEVAFDYDLLTVRAGNADNSHVTITPHYSVVMTWILKHTYTLVHIIDPPVIPRARIPYVCRIWPPVFGQILTWPAPTSHFITGKLQPKGGLAWDIAMFPNGATGSRFRS